MGVPCQLALIAPSNFAQRKEQRSREQRTQANTPQQPAVRLDAVPESMESLRKQVWELNNKLKGNHRDTERDPEMDRDTEKGEWEGGRNPERDSGSRDSE